MYGVIHKCKLCNKIEEESIDDNEIDLKNHKYPLKSALKYHECEDGSVGVSELIGYKRIPNLCEKIDRNNIPTSRTPI